MPFVSTCVLDISVCMCMHLKGETISMVFFACVVFPPCE